HTQQGDGLSVQPLGPGLGLGSRRDPVDRAGREAGRPRQAVDPVDDCLPGPLLVRQLLEGGVEDCHCFTAFWSGAGGTGPPTTLGSGFGTVGATRPPTTRAVRRLTDGSLAISTACSRFTQLSRLIVPASRP